MRVKEDLNRLVQEMVNSWTKYHNPKELEKDVKQLLVNVSAKVRNKFEFSLHGQLKKSGRQFGYEVVRLPYTLQGYYWPDWVVYKNRKRTKIDFYIEAKGYFRPEAKRKLIAVKTAHPEADIRIVFYARRTKDIKWAEKNGFKYAIRTIPEEWLK